MESHRALLVSIVFASLVACGSDADSDSGDSEALVREAYAGYKSAILAGDGEGAAEFVDRNTIDYYQRMRDLAYRAPRDEVDALRTMDKMTVFIIRHRMAPEAVRTSDGRALFVHAVDQGWIGKSSVVSNSLGDVAVEGDVATGVHVTNGKPTPIHMLFRNEEGRWRLDLTSTMTQVDVAFRQLAESSGEDTNAFLFRLITSVSGEQVTDAVWIPMAE